jgi:hypothetical protein
MFLTRRTPQIEHRKLISLHHALAFSATVESKSGQNDLTVRPAAFDGASAFRGLAACNHETLYFGLILKSCDANHMTLDRRARRNPGSV